MAKQELRIGSRSIPEILGLLTLEEKAAFLSGKDVWHLAGLERLGIPSIMVTDGPHGLRKQDEHSNNLGLGDSVPAVCFPPACLSACSWDPSLLQQMGEAIAEEALSERISVVLGPGVNMKRSPLCGRNFEYFSEDPYLAGELGAAYIAGVQSKGVGTSLKHFAANNQETRRLAGCSVVDERTLREIYLPAFENAVKKAQPWTVMNCYNKVNGVHGSDNHFLQTQILRDEWGFEGLVVSDWGAVNNRVQGITAGNDLEMPSSSGYNTRKLIDAVTSGRLTMDALDVCVTRVLELIAKSMPVLEKEQPRYDENAHHALARKIVGESAVLLKNEDSILPLQRDKKLLVIGEMAQNPRIQGDGSSLIHPTRVDNACDCLRQAGYSISYQQGYEKSQKKTLDAKKLFMDAVEAAKKADTVLLFIGLTEGFESEGFDRKNLQLPSVHNELVQAVSNVNPNLVVVLTGGSPVELPWFDEVKGILGTYLGGQAGAGGIADILSGSVNPSGKLAETYPLCLTDTPCNANFPGNPLTVEYRESIFVGYRYYDKVEKPVRFPFGFGLSYTQFTYSALKLSRKKMADSDSLTVSFQVKNTGSCAGAEIAQLYVTDSESTIFRAPKDLKGFRKIYLEPGESQTVTLALEKRAFAYYNVQLGDWHVESGGFEILIGTSSQDILLRGKVTVESTAADVQPIDYRAKAAVYYDGDPAKASGRALEVLLGTPLPPAFKNVNDPITLDDTFETASHTVWGARINKLIHFATAKLPQGEMIGTTALQLRFCQLIAMSGGLFTTEMAQGLLRVLNGDKPGKGFYVILRGLPNLLIQARQMFSKT